MKKKRKKKLSQSWRRTVWQYKFCGLWKCVLIHRFHSQSGDLWSSKSQIFLSAWELTDIKQRIFHVEVDLKFFDRMVWVSIQMRKGCNAISQSTFNSQTVRSIFQCFCITPKYISVLDFTSYKSENKHLWI